MVATSSTVILSGILNDKYHYDKIIVEQIKFHVDNQTYRKSNEIGKSRTQKEHTRRNFSLLNFQEDFYSDR